MNYSKNKQILSPIQPAIKSVHNTLNVHSEKYPVRNEVQRFCGTYNITATFSEDTQTLSSFRHIPGMIAILCTLKKDGQLISFGRSTAVFSRFNRYIERTVFSAINGSLLSAVNNATKIFETLQTGKNTEEMPPKFEEIENQEMTEKQKNFLLQLVLDIDDPDTREEYLSQLNSGLSRGDASDLIASLLPVK